MPLSMRANMSCCEFAFFIEQRSLNRIAETPWSNAKDVQRRGVMNERWVTHPFD